MAMISIDAKKYLDLKTPIKVKVTQKVFRQALAFQKVAAQSQKAFAKYNHQAADADDMEVADDNVAMADAALNLANEQEAFLRQVLNLSATQCRKLDDLSPDEMSDFSLDVVNKVVGNTGNENNNQTKNA